MRRDQLQPATVSDTESEARLAENRKTNAEGELLALSEAKKTLESKASLLREDISSFEKRKLTIEGEIEVLKKRRDDAGVLLTDYNDRVRVEMEEKAAELNIVLDDVARAVASKKQLQEELDKLDEKKVALENAVRESEANIGRMQDQRASLIKEISEKELVVDKTEALLGELNEEIATVQKKKTSIGLEVAKEAEKLSSFKGAVSDANVELLEEQNKIKLAQQELAELQEKNKKEHEALDEKIASADERLHLLSLAEDRIEQRKEFVLRLVEKAQVDGLLRKDFQL